MAKRTLSPGALRRLCTEESRMKNDCKGCGFEASPSIVGGEKDYTQWDVYITGPGDSLYENCILHAILIFDYNYPLVPPKMKFVTEMFHPNIFKDGNVCISILHMASDDPTSYEKPDENWTPVQNIRTVVLSVISMLNEPNINSPANVDASKLFKNAYEEYCEKVKELMKAQKK
ncbi:Ubiquitin-conjugating enzyme E2 [Spraguea lophii 42_110]|uniref:Ubiquitin-conjugating enzyme E2 n=1 Tax=Spraguea lophii (strain 42_110) TaxID=1358809 RepID=S7WB91_SPRLO|nr:Ubiquitin-conjugating enzyme E2 [Spraguea lophii 42_110]